MSLRTSTLLLGSENTTHSLGGLASDEVCDKTYKLLSGLESRLAIRALTSRQLLNHMPESIGKPGRFAALQRFVDHVQSHDRVWLCRGIDIAEHWRKHHPAPA